MSCTRIAIYRAASKAMKRSFLMGPGAYLALGGAGSLAVSCGADTRPMHTWAAASMVVVG